MENLEEAKNLVSEAKNIYIIPEQSNKECLSTGLGLFYTLKDLDKNVNLIIEDLPESLKFLTPSPDFITLPKNFVISIPDNVAKISQIYYEKNSENLKIHLTMESGNIKKDNISFYFSEPKPDLIITLGIKDYDLQLKNSLNAFGFLLDSPILNIDEEPTGKGDRQTNKKFGKINLIGQQSVTETALSLVNNPRTDSVKKEAANCFLAGIAIYTENFSNSKISPETFESASTLMKKGGDLQTIKNSLFK